MNDNEDRPRLDSLFKELAILPPLGFLIAFCYEGSFFFFLGINFQYVLNLEDIVRSSVLSVLPAIPFILFAFFSGSAPTHTPGKEFRDKALYYSHITADKFIYIIVIGSAGLYLLLGAAPEVGALFTFVSLLVIITRVAIAPKLKPDHLIGFFVIWPVIYIMIAFAGLGTNKAFRIRAGEREKFPLATFEGIKNPPFQSPHVLRTFTSGFLVGDSQKDKVWLVNKNTNTILEFKINPEPFKGVLCYTFDWCWANGWVFDRNGNP